MKPKVYEKKTADIPSEDSKVAKDGPEHNYAPLLSPAVEEVDKISSFDIGTMFIRVV